MLISIKKYRKPTKNFKSHGYKISKSSLKTIYCTALCTKHTALYTKRTALYSSHLPSDTFEPHCFKFLMGNCAKKKGVYQNENHYHFVIPTERSDEESLMLTLRFFTNVQNDTTIR